MEVIVDGIIYQLQPHGGISRLFSEILPRMCQADETLNITLLMTGHSRQELLLLSPILYYLGVLCLRSRELSWDALKKLQTLPSSAKPSREITSQAKH